MIAEKRQEVESMMKETEFLSQLLVSLTKDKQQLQQSIDRLKYDHGKYAACLLIVGWENNMTLCHC